MRTLNPSFIFVCTLLVAGLLALPACSINVKKDQSGEDKKVDIDTPLGGIHVSKNADVRDVGLAVYPGARIVDKNEDGDEKSANVNISSSHFRLKVVAVEYRTNDAPEKVIAFYKNELKQYGDVLECHSSGHGDVSMEYNDKSSKDLKCEGDSGKNIELKAGSRDKQHIVSVEPENKGSKFALVFVQTRGDETI